MGKRERDKMRGREKEVFVCHTVRWKYASFLTLQLLLISLRIPKI